MKSYFEIVYDIFLKQNESPEHILQNLKMLINCMLLTVSLLPWSKPFCTVTSLIITFLNL